MTQRTRVYVELIHHLDAHGWPQRNSTGEVPNRTPFGIDELAGYGMDVTFRPALTGGLREKVLRRLRERTDNVEWAEALSSTCARGQRRTDIVVCWDEFTGIPAAELTRIPGSAPVLTGVQLLSDPDRWTPDFLRRARRALQRADGVFVHSECMIAPLRDRWGVDIDRIHYVPFGIDADWFHPSVDGVDRDLVVSVGDDLHRDHATLIDAMSGVRAARPRTRLELATQLDVRLPSELGTVHRGHLGARRPTFYGHAAVVAVAAHPNLHGSGMSVVLEAMACGRPYVVTASDGLRDYLRHNEDGIVVPPGDTTAMATAITELLNDPDRADAMGAAGRQRIENTLTTRHQARHLATTIADVLHHHRYGTPRLTSPWEHHATA